MNRVSVESDMMRSVGHNASTAILEVEFCNGSIYEYADVPRHHYVALLAAASKGRFFNASVRGVFSFRRII